MAEKGILRKAIDDLVKHGPVQELIEEQKPKFLERIQIWMILEERAAQTDPVRYMKYIGIGRHHWDWWAYVVFNQSWGTTGLEMIIDKDKSVRDTSAEVSQTMKDIFTNQKVGEFTETVGAFITDPILNILEQYAGDDTKDPKDFARSFHGILATITGSAGLVDTVTEALSLGQVEGLGRMIQSVYWNLGLGFLGWQTMAPLLSAGLQPGLERYYQRLYRPQRFNSSQLQDLYAIGKINADKFVTELKTLGWRDEDVTNFIQLSYRQLTQGDIWELLKQGKISEQEAVSRLRALGYSPEDIPLIFSINADQYISETKETTKTTALQAYREHLIPESELRSLLSKLKITDHEIDLIVAVENARNTQDARSLSVSQIKQSWNSNVLSDQEAAHYLRKAGFGDSDVNVLLQSWRVESVPEFRKINKSTVTEAYVQGILSRSDAILKLQSIGFSSEDAVLEVDLTERRNPEAFGLPSTKKTRTLAPGTMAALVAAGVLTSDQMMQKLIQNGYTEEDARLYALAADIRSQESPEKIDQYTIERAYAAEVLDRSEAMGYLMDLDFEVEQANIILDIVEAENPAIFNPTLLTSVRLPSISALVEASRNGLINEVQFYERATEIGYTHQDAAMYLAISLTNERKNTKELTAAQIVNAYGKDLFTRGQALERLVSMGYSDSDATILLKMEKLLVTETEAWASMLSYALSPADAILQLISDGFDIQDIVESFEQLSNLKLADLKTSREEVDEMFHYLLYGDSQEGG